MTWYWCKREQASTEDEEVGRGVVLMCAYACTIERDFYPNFCVLIRHLRFEKIIILNIYIFLGCFASAPRVCRVCVEIPRQIRAERWSANTRRSNDRWWAGRDRLMFVSVLMLPIICHSINCHISFTMITFKIIAWTAMKIVSVGKFVDKYTFIWC